MKLAELLNKALENKASDIHIAVGEKPALRISRQLKYIETDALTTEQINEFAKEILAPEALKSLESKHSIDAAYENNKQRYRVNVFHSDKGLAIALRLLKEEVPTLSEMGAPPIIESLTNANNGLILVTGPSGSGKSTTLAAMIEHINRNSNKRIITIEDPIEYKFKNKKSMISQCELDSSCSSFASVLRSTLRKDPDVIMIGELRDLATMRLALTAAETGHLVIATLHTNSAVSTISRVIDSFPRGEKPMVGNVLSMVLRGVISQRLLPLNNAKGVIAAYGVLLITTAVANLIRQDKIHQIPSTMQISSKQGMIQLKEYVARLIAAGKVDKSVLAMIDDHKNGFNVEDNSSIKYNDNRT